MLRLWPHKRRDPSSDASASGVALSAFHPATPPASFRFLDAGPLIDGELELVEPSPRWVESLLLTAAMPACRSDPAAQLNRHDLLRFLEQFPRGRQRANPFRGHANGYTFWIRLRGPGVPLEMAGNVSLRLGQEDENLVRYLGHIGYGVYPPARGRHLAERATRLLFPLARAHGHRELWITANPENAPSRRTCERLGGELVDIVDLPAGHPLYERGERRKCRYRITL